MSVPTCKNSNLRGFSQIVFCSYLLLFVLGIGPRIGSAGYQQSITSPPPTSRPNEPAYHQPKQVARILMWNKFFQLTDPQLWKPQQRVPCWQDRIQLPDHYAIFLNHRLETSELILPQDGELIVGPNADIRLASDQVQPDQVSCSNSDKPRLMEFDPSRNPTSWFEPDHWSPLLIDTKTDFENFPMPISNFVGASGLHGLSSIPHSERIPCPHDMIEFPLNGSFKVRIDRTDLVPKFMLLSIGKQSYMSSQFPEFTSTFYGRLLFDVGGFGDQWDKITSYDSSQPKTMVCGNDSPKVMSLICRYMGECNPSQLSCRDPIQPVGFCCPICGSAIVFGTSQSKSSARFPSQTLIYRAIVRRVMQSMFDEEPELHRLVHIYLHWLHDTRFQLVATEATGAAKASGIERIDPNDVDLLRKYGVSSAKQLSDRYVAKLKQALTNDYQSIPNFPMQLWSSVDWYESGLGLRLLAQFGSVLAVLFILALLSIPFYQHYRRTHFDPGFTFVRFRSHASDIELELDPNSQLVAAAIAQNRQFNSGTDKTDGLEASPSGGSTCDVQLIPSATASVDPTGIFLKGSPTVTVGKTMANSVAKQLKFIASLAIPAGHSSVASFQSLKSSESVSSIGSPIRATVGTQPDPQQPKQQQQRQGLTENFDNPIFRLFSGKSESESNENHSNNSDQSDSGQQPSNESEKYNI